MYKSLVIGCGNIGALYDLNSDKILTHTKGYIKNGNFQLSIYDPNDKLTREISKKYKVLIVNDIKEQNLSEFDCVSICSPTDTHFMFLKNAMKAKVKVIICEKPVSYKKYEIPLLIDLYNNCSSKIIVNYMRRFNPEYIKLKELIKNILLEEQLTNISIRYQRGFINNCSHAFDLLKFFFDKDMNLTDINKSNVKYDSFEYDPTLSLQAKWDDVNFNVLGLSNVLFSLFEIDMFFKFHRISITEAGMNINTYVSNENNKSLKKEFIQENCIDNYMIPLVNYSVDLLKNKLVSDNFIDALQTNINMLNILEND